MRCFQWILRAVSRNGDCGTIHIRDQKSSHAYSPIFTRGSPSAPPRSYLSRSSRAAESRYSTMSHTTSSFLRCGEGKIREHPNVLLTTTLPSFISTFILHRTKRIAIHKPTPQPSTTSTWTPLLILQKHKRPQKRLRCHRGYRNGFTLSSKAAPFGNDWRFTSWLPSLSACLGFINNIRSTGC